MDKELLQTLSNLFEEKLKPIQNDINGLKTDVKDMHDVIKDLKTNQTRIEKKLDNVVDQTAGLTEFRTTTLNRLDDITDALNRVESITASNWKDITKLKSIK